MPDTRPVHLIVIDGWHPGLLELELARLPALSFMVAAGSLDKGCVSTFPTVTPTALATLVTGTPPSEHGIQGILWYHRQEDRYIHYWPSLASLMSGTLPRVLRDILLNLNGAHLSWRTPTMFERLERAGLVCASVNFPLSRGPYLHQATLPWLARCLAGMGKHLAVCGPSHCYVGDFIRPPGFKRLGWVGRYGLGDAQASAYAQALIRSQRPDFSLVYFNEHDLRSHHAGPMGCARSLQQVDAELGKLMMAYGSWEKAVEQARWLLVGDHAQSAIGGVPDYAVPVFQALPGWRVAPLGQGRLLRDGHDLAIAPNDRSALLYLRDPRRRGELVASLMTWPSAELIAWKEGAETVCVRAETGRMCSWTRGGPLRDPHGACWSLVGDLEVLDLRIRGDGLDFGAYPDALARLEHALHDADVVLSARPRYEYTAGMTMGKGNHGSLAKEDSLVPLLTIGLQPLPRPIRTLDLAGVVMQAFGLSPTLHSEWSPTWPSSANG